MSPEAKITVTGSMIGDARIMTDELLAAQEEMHAEEKERRQAKVSGIRARLHIEEPEFVDTSKITNTRIKRATELIAPELVEEALPLTPEVVDTTLRARINIEAVLKGKDDKLVVIVGPCSIHDPEAAIEYAEHVKKWREQYSDELEIVMRAYPEKPRTELKKDPIESWRGITKDPYLDGSNDINLGLVLTRMFTRKIVHMGVPVAMERVNAITPQYVDGLVAYDAIGARTTTSQNAREYASGTSAVVGFKNTTEGSILAAVEAVASANVENTFTGVSMEGPPQETWGTGNDTAHIIHRGADSGPNFSKEHIVASKKLLQEKSLLEAIGIDLSHGNSAKKAEKQLDVAKDVATQIRLGEKAIKLVLIESNLIGGAQNLKKLREKGKQPEYGKSITDECIDLDKTKEILQLFAGAVMSRRALLKAGVI